MTKLVVKFADDVIIKYDRCQLNYIKGKGINNPILTLSILDLSQFVQLITACQQCVTTVRCQ